MLLAVAIFISMAATSCSSNEDSGPDFNKQDYFENKWKCDGPAEVVTYVSGRGMITDQLWIFAESNAGHFTVELNPEVKWTGPANRLVIPESAEIHLVNSHESKTIIAEDEWQKWGYDPILTDNRDIFDSRDYKVTYYDYVQYSQETVESKGWQTEVEIDEESKEVTYMPFVKLKANGGKLDLEVSPNLINYERELYFVVETQVEILEKGHISIDPQKLIIKVTQYPANRKPEYTSK